MIEFAYFLSCDCDFSALSAKKVCQMGKSNRLIFLCFVYLSAGFITGTEGRTSVKLVGRKQFWLVWSIVNTQLLSVTNRRFLQHVARDSKYRFISSLAYNIYFKFSLQYLFQTICLDGVGSYSTGCEQSTSRCVRLVWLQQTLEWNNGFCLQ
jgi:hypothetical protein